MEILDIDPEKIDWSKQEEIKSIVLKVFNAYGSAVSGIAQRDEEIQKLKDEINRLKGEKGKPKFKPNRKDDDDNKDDQNYQVPENNKRQRNRPQKKQNIRIDREETVDFSEEEKKELPPDAVFKGYRDIINQNIKFVTDNVKVNIARYYSPSEKKVYEPELPEQYRYGEYGAEVFAFTFMLYFIGRVPEDKIVWIFNEVGVSISKSKVVNIITGNESDFSKEKTDILKAGFKTTNYQQTDDTGMRVNGINCYLNVYCNQYYSAFKINDNKKRETIKKYFESLGLETRILLADDAPQFKLLTEFLMLCWVHEGRHYKKFNPVLSFQKRYLEDFLNRFWKYYARLKEYKKNPAEDIKNELEKEFEEIFNTVTGFKELDHRVELTKAKKEYLLVVLDFPDVPLHNNGSEQELREGVIKRRISYGVKSEKGKLAWENHLTISRTCRKQGVSYWEYIKNMFYGIEQTSLADRVSACATT